MYGKSFANGQEDEKDLACGRNARCINNLGTMGFSPFGFVVCPARCGKGNGGKHSQYLECQSLNNEYCPSSIVFASAAAGGLH